MRVAPTTSQVFKVLGDEHRLRILDFLATGDATCCSTGQGICGCDIEQVVGLAQATVSHHMKLLVEAGLVSAKKRGRWVHYTLNPEGFQAARQFAEKYLALSQKLVSLEVAV